ncbi:glycosyltransferase [Microbulbifer magnicolonia]|uniref:glycosyltransferase n=1 Tax=Microbulbifer magnicolonia TaxID=3109744 RepID=UPI002B417734|nr:glycosyltransferase [Microbulbifer sp. GG15]
MEKHVADLSRWQAHNTEAKVSVIAHPRYQNTLDERVHFVPLNTDRSRHHPTLVWRLANHIRAGEYQIAHGHGSKSAQLLAAVQKYTEAQQVITRHNVRHPRDKLASAFAARIAVSRTVVANSRLTWNIIPNGADISTQESAPVDIDSVSAACILVAVRLLKLNSVVPLLEALLELPQVQMTILGDGPDKARLVQLANNLSLGDRARFTGNCDKIGSCMRAADLLLIPLHNESQPYLLAEALLHGCPVIAGRVGNAEEYIPAAYLLDNLEVPHLVATLRGALQDKKKLRRDFARAFERASNELTLAHMAQATWQVYSKLVD